MWEKNSTVVKAMESHNDCSSKLGTLESIRVFEHDYNNHLLTQFYIKSSPLRWLQQVALLIIYLSEDISYFLNFDCKLKVSQ